VSFIIIHISHYYHQQTEAQVAQTSLHGRWFAGRMIKAAFYDEQLFLAGDYASTCLSATSTD
jgi:poly-D-alanine transfer protein DltD